MGNSSQILPFFIREVARGMTGNPDAFSVNTVTGHAQAFAKINFSSGFNSFRRRFIGAVHILSFFQDIRRDPRLINIFMERKRLWQEAECEYN